MPQPLLSPEWVQLTPTTRLRTVRFGNNAVLVFLMFHGMNRVASYISAKLAVDTIGGAGQDVDVAVQFGDRDDVWSQILCRRLIELAGQDVVLAVSAKAPKTERECRGVLVALEEQFKF